MKYILKRAFLLALFAVMVSLTSFAAEAKMQVTFLDCHQGDTLIIRTAEKTIMIDAGDDNRNVAQAYIIPYFKKEGIKRIDQAIISHPHRDHFGGFAELVKQFDFGEFVYSNDTNISSEGGKSKGDALFYQKLVDLLAKKKIPYRRAKVGELLDWGKDVRAEVVFTDDGSFGDISKGNANEMSIIIKATCGKISYLFTGDAEKKAEEAAINRFGKKLHSTVLKSGHHGSKTSSTHAFMDMVQPQYGVISCGKGNSFGHPTQSTLDIYDYYKMTVFRTDHDGTVESYTDGKTITFASNRSPLEITKEPKVISLTPNTATLQWETNKEASADVKVAAENKAVRAAKTSAGTSKGHTHLSKIHTVTVTGLKPSTKYSFKVMNGDPREMGKQVSASGSFQTPAGDGVPLPAFAALRTSSKEIFMKSGFNILVQAHNPAQKASAATTVEVYHSTIDKSNLIGKASFGKIGADETLQIDVPAQIDWLGDVSIIAVLKQGKTIIDTKSISIQVNAKRILVDCSHGNKEYYMGKFAGLKMDLFQNLGYQMSSISKGINASQLKDASAVIIPSPSKDFTVDEIAALKKYSAAGGAVMMFCSSDYKDYSKPAYLNKLIKAIGGKVFFNDDQACEEKPQSIGAPWKFFITNFPSKDITGTSKKLLTNSPCSLVSSNGSALKATKAISVLAKGTATSYTLDGDGKNDALYIYQKGGSGVPVIAAESAGKARFAYYGDSFYKDNYYSNPAGLSTPQFNRAVMAWLTAPRKATSKSIVRSIASLEDENDVEIRADRYEVLSADLMNKIRNNEASIEEVKSQLDNYSGEAVNSMRLELEEVSRFKQLYGE